MVISLFHASQPMGLPAQSPKTPQAFSAARHNDSQAMVQWRRVVDRAVQNVASVEEIGMMNQAILGDCLTRPGRTHEKAAPANRGG